MDTCIGVQFKDFVILAADKTEGRGILRLSEDSSKIHKLTSNAAMAVVGDSGDSDQFSRFVQCNFELEKFRDDGWEVSLTRAFHWITWDLAQRIRKNPMQVNIILGGYDHKEKIGKIYWIDYMGSGVETTYAGHGYGETFAIGFLDRFHRFDMTKEEAIELVKGSINAMQTRIVVGQNRFEMKLIDKDGVHLLADHVVDRALTHPK